jgi:hypothetical protein
MNTGEEGGKALLLEHLEGVGKAALKLGYFGIVNQALNDIRNLKEESKTTATSGLFCTECHKPRKGS